MGVGGGGEPPEAAPPHSYHRQVGYVVFWFKFISPERGGRRVDGCPVAPGAGSSSRGNQPQFHQPQSHQLHTAQEPSPFSVAVWLFILCSFAGRAKGSCFLVPYETKPGMLGTFLKVPRAKSPGTKIPGRHTWRWFQQQG